MQHPGPIPADHAVPVVSALREEQLEWSSAVAEDCGYTATVFKKKVNQLLVTAKLSVW